VSFDAKRLYELLPAIYRARDAERGGPLQALLAVIAGEVAVLEENLEQLYDDQFIETCAEWVVPYVGDLVGCRPLHGISPGVASPRAEVAHTIGYRRRKGTAAVLEQLARDVTGWQARVVEFFQLTAATQHMNHARGDAPVTPDLREWESLERLGGAFERTPRTAEVRRVASGLGKYNVPNLGIYLWRLRACPLTSSTAFRVDDRRYRFSPLGNDAALFSRPEPEREITHLAEPVNVPAPISRRVLDQYPSSYYGRRKSLP